MSGRKRKEKKIVRHTEKKVVKQDQEKVAAETSSSIRRRPAALDAKWEEKDHLGTFHQRRDRLLTYSQQSGKGKSHNCSTVSPRETSDETASMIF